MKNRALKRRQKTHKQIAREAFITEFKQYFSRYLRLQIDQILILLEGMHHHGKVMIPVHLVDQPEEATKEEYMPSITFKLHCDFGQLFDSGSYETYVQEPLERLTSLLERAKALRTETYMAEPYDFSDDDSDF
jgi:hypothetical protein